MAAQDAELKLKVSLDLAFFRQQLAGLGQVAAGYQMPINVKFDRRAVQNELNALSANIRQRNYRLNVNTNIKEEIENVKKLKNALISLQAAASGAKNKLPLGVSQLNLTKSKQGLDVSEIKKLYEALAIAGVEGFERGTKKTRPEMIAQIGAVSRDTIAGLLNGLKSGDASVQAAAKSLGKNLIDSIKGVLGIASPSREFKKIGEDSGEGFEQGLKSGLGEAAKIGIKEMRDLFRALQGEAQAGAARLQATMLGAMAGIVQLPGGRQQRQRLLQTGGTVNAAMTGGAIQNIRARQQGVRGQAAAASVATPSFLTALPLMMGMGRNELTARLSGLYGQQFQAPRMGAGAPNVLGQIIQSLGGSRGALGTGGGIAGQLFAGGARNPGISPTGYIGRSALSAGFVNYPPSLPAAYAGGFTGAGGSRFKMNAGSMGQFPMAGMMKGGVGAGAGSFVPMAGERNIGRLGQLFTDLTGRMKDTGATIRRQLMPTFGDLRQEVVENRRRTAIELGAYGMLGGTRFLGQRGRLERMQFPSEGMMLPGGMTAMQQRFAQVATRENAIGGGLLGSSYASRSGAHRLYQFPMAGMMGPFSSVSPGQINAQTSMFGPNGPAGPGNRPPGGIFGGYGGRGGGGGIIPPGGFPSDGMMGRSSQLGTGYFAAGKAIDSFKKSYEGIRGYLDKNKLPLGGAIAEVGSEFGNAIKQVLLFGTAYKALAFITDLPNQAFEAAKGLATYRNQLQAVTGDASGFERSFAFVDNLAQRFNVPLESARQGFVKLYASMQPAGFNAGQIENLFTGISKATAAFGLSADKVDRVNYAFAQMASKGQIMSEELKGQLGDVLPGALALFAQAAQMSIPEFSKAMEDGAFKGKAMMQVLDNVAILMNSKFGPAAQGASKTLQGALNQIQNNLKLMYESMTPIVNAFAATFGPKVNSLIKDVTSTMQVLTGNFIKGSDAVSTLNPRAQAFYSVIQQLKPALLEAGRAIADLGSYMASLGPVVIQVVAAMVKFAASPVGRAAIVATAAITALNGALKLLTSAGIIPAIQQLYRFIGGLLKIPAATGAARVGVIALRAALTGVVLGTLLVGLDILIEKLFGIGDAADSSMKDVKKLAYTLNEMAGAGDIIGLAGKRQEAENQVVIAERLLQTYQKMERISYDRLTKQERQFLREFGTKNPFERGVSFAEKELTRALEARGTAQAALEAAQAAADREREQREKDLNDKLQKIDLSASEKTKTTKAQSLESLESLADQLAKARTEGEIERANILFEHKKKLLDMQFAYEESGADEIQQTRIKFAKELSDAMIGYEEEVFKARQAVTQAAGSVAPGNRPPNAPKGQGPYGPITDFGAGLHSNIREGMQVGSLAPARPVSGSEKRDVVAAAKTEQAQLVEALRLNTSLEQAIKKVALITKQNLDALFPVAQLTLQNKLLATRNALELKGIPKEVIDLKESLYLAEEKSNGILQELRDQYNKQLPIYEKYKKMQEDGIELTKAQRVELATAAIAVELFGQNSDYATDQLQKFTTAQLENTLATLKQQDALKAIQEISGRINQAVEGVTGTYKDLFKEIAKGTNSVEALKKAQDALADQFLTMFFDFAMKPVEDFFKKTLGSIFKVPNEEETRANMIKKLEEQLAKQQEIASNTKRTADNTQPGGGGAPGAVPPQQSANTIGPSMPSSNPQDASYQQGGAASIASELPLSAFTSISESLGTLTDSATAYAEKLKTVTVDSWETVKLGGKVAQDAKDNGDKFKESLGKATQAVGIAAGAIMGIAAGINQIKEGGTSNVLGGIGSILLSVGGAIAGFGNVFNLKGFANGGVAKGGFVPFRAFANGGTVGGPTLGLMGEGKYNEAIVPLPDGRSIPVRLNSSSIREKMTSQAASPVLNMSFQTTNIGGTEYVSRDQLEQAMAQTRKLAANDGARRGMGMTLDRLQQSPSTRSRLGMR